MGTEKILVLKNFSGNGLWNKIISKCPEVNIVIVSVGRYLQPDYDTLNTIRPDIICADLVNRKEIPGNENHNLTVPKTIAHSLKTAYEKYRHQRPVELVLAYRSSDRPNIDNLIFSKEIQYSEEADSIIEQLGIRKSDNGVKP
jgi:hypothetical protein